MEVVRGIEKQSSVQKKLSQGSEDGHHKPFPQSRQTGIGLRKRFSEFARDPVIF